ncbi:hypothetical protein, partial [Mesorhizobium sp.]|uniref:hypothetical protein n=1 Tax=Mesorhizobium sp. TaxID=1871066 RepID=UPI00257CE735
LQTASPQEKGVCLCDPRQISGRQIHSSPTAIWILVALLYNIAAYPGGDLFLSGAIMRLIYSFHLA